MVKGILSTGYNQSLESVYTEWNRLGLGSMKIESRVNSHYSVLAEKSDLETLSLLIHEGETEIFISAGISRSYE